MIFTHGGNSISRDAGEKFIVLYNGISNRGLPITSGSFGTISRDTSGPLIAPDGLGMPYFNRRNFGGNLVVSEHDEMKAVFNSKNWTVDFWLSIHGGNNNVCQNNIVDIRNADNTNILWCGEQYYQTPYVTTYNIIGSMKFTSSSTWSHIAIVSDASSGYCVLYQNGIKINQQAINNNVADANRIRFGYYYTSQLDSNLQCYIAQFAVRDYPVWTTNFTPPTQMY